MKHDFGPRRVGELLDDSISLVRANWKTVLGVSAVVLLPIGSAYSVVASFYLRGFLELFGSGIRTVTSGGTPPQPGQDLLLTAVLLQALSLLYVLAKAMFDSTLFSSSAHLLERRRVPLKEALRGGVKAVVPLVVVQIIAGLASGGVALAVGLVLGIVATVLILLLPAVGVVGVVGIGVAYLAGIIAYATTMVMLAVAYPIVVIEGGIGSALGRSFRLVRRHFWRVLLILAAIALVGGQFESALAAPTLIREFIVGVTQPSALLGQIAWGWKVFDGLMQGIAIAVVVPFTSAAVLLTYLDLRARDEGMDLLVRARELTAA